MDSQPPPSTMTQPFIFTEMADFVTDFLLEGAKENRNPSALSATDTKEPTLAVPKDEGPKVKSRKKKKKRNPSAPPATDNKESTLDIPKEEDPKIEPAKEDPPSSSSTAAPVIRFKLTNPSVGKRKNHKRHQKQPDTESEPKPEPKPMITRYLKKRRREVKVIMNRRPHFTREMAEAVVNCVDGADSLQSDNERDKLILTSDTDSDWDEAKMRQR